MKPITPAEVVKRKVELMPAGVIEAFNDLIAERWDGHSASVKQNDAVVAVMAKLKQSMPDLKREDLFEKHWLDVEDLFRKAGWSVAYDKPGYNEDYDAYWVFKPKKKGG